ncbi:MAG: ABC transporter ATP-binding protein [Bdellovibrionales bacterium]
MKVQLKNVEKSFGKTKVINRFNLDIPSAKSTFLMGPSGSGKTTLLRMIAGFESVDDGEIYIDGQLVSSKQLQVAPAQRKLGYVFQDYALFPHLNVYDNVAFGLQHLKSEDIENRVLRYLELVGISDHLKKLPHQLSGGQQQRVALARALAPEPQLLLFDEVFSNLDEHLKRALGREVKDILSYLGLTSIFVSHLQEEAFELADNLVIMQNGKVEQQGHSYEVYHEPSNYFVANFIGDGRYIEAEIMPTRCLSFANIEICNNKKHELQPGEKVKILLRPDDVIHDDDSPITASVIHKAFRGPVLEYELQLETGEKILSYVPSHHNHAIGERIGIRFEIDHIVSF